jgi:hypothetical protein
MTIMVEQMRDIGRYRLNGTKEDWEEFASHFGFLYREEITTDSKPGKDDRSLLGSEYVWKRNGPDHFCHALLYSDIGMQRFNHSQAKIFGTRNAMSGIPKAEMVDANGMVRSRGVPSADMAQAVLLNWDSAK